MFITIFIYTIVAIGRSAMMKIFTPFTVILLVLSTNALPYQSNNGTGRFDQDFVGIDSSIDRIGIESPIDRIGPKRLMPIPRGMHITRDEEGKNRNFASGSKTLLPYIYIYIYNSFS